MLQIVVCSGYFAINVILLLVIVSHQMLCHQLKRPFEYVTFGRL